MIFEIILFIGCRRLVLLLTASVVLICMPANANNIEKFYQFDIRSESVIKSLGTFSVITELSSLFSYDLVKTKKSKPLKGRYTAQQALKILLTGTGLKAEILENNTFLVKPNLALVENEQLVKEGDKKLKTNKTLLASMLAMMFTPVHGAEDTQEKETKEDAEVIQIMGIRASLASAHEVKRESNKIVDAIVAEDIGKLPDSNVAEALQRVTGVQLMSNVAVQSGGAQETGEGAKIAIRGMSADLNRSEINGMSFAGTGSSREADFRNIPSEFISKIEVVKSPTASMTEGAVGGTVNISTIRPFDAGGGFKSFASLKSQIKPGADTDATNPYALNTFVYISNTFGDKFGASFMYNQGEYNGRSDIMENIVTNYGDYNGDGNSEYFPFAPRYWMSTTVEDRKGFTSSLQYRPTEGLEFIFDMTHSKRTADISNRVVNYVYNGTFSNLQIAQDGTPGATVVGLTTDDSKYQGLTSEFTETRETDTYSLTTDWKASEDLTVTALLGISEGSYDKPLVNLYYGMVSPEHTYSVAGEDNIWRTTQNISSLGKDASEWDSYTGQFNFTKTDQKETLAQLDFKYYLDQNFIESVETGVQLRNTQFDNLNARDIKTITAENTPAGFTPNELVDLPAEFGELYSGSTDGIPTDFWTPSSQLTGAFFDQTTVNHFANYDASVLDAGGVWGIEEKVSSAYVQANFYTPLEDMSLSGNFGLRYTKTETETNGFANAATAGFNEPVSREGDYSDILPAFNISLEVSDNLTVRAAAAKVLARPKIADLVPSFVYNEPALTASSGNTDLDPFRANQYDLIVEYYNDSTTLTAGLFYKDLESLVTTTSESVDIFNNGDIYNLIRPVNGEGATIKGLELGANHNFINLPEPFNGLGISGNYTYIDSTTTDTHENTGEALAFTGLAKTSYNLQGYWEGNGFSANIGLNYRGDYVLSPVMFGNGGPQIQEAFTDLSLGLSYEFNEHVTASVSGSNLLNESVRVTSEPGPNRNISSMSFGRFFEAGISYKF